MAKLTPIINTDRKPLHELLPLKQPLRINIDPSDACNFKCDFCFQSRSNDFKGSIMSVDTFDRVLRQIQEFDEQINVVQLFGLGEPLLNKNVPLFIRKIREKNISKKVKITTNGSLLNHALIDDLMDAGLDELVISLNGLSDDDFVRVVNTKVDFNSMFDNIKYLYKHRGKCHFHIKIIGDYFSEEKKKYFTDTIGAYADTINIDGATNHWSDIKITEKHQQQYAVAEMIFNEWPICALCFYELMVHSDGSVSPCVADWQKDRQNLGNVYDSTLKEIWNSKLRKDMILSFLKGEESPYIACRACEYPLSGASVNLEPYKKELLEKYV